MNAPTSEDRGNNASEPLEITTFYPREPEVIDPRHMPPPGFYRRRTAGNNPRVAAMLFIAACISVFLVGMEPGAPMGVLTLLSEKLHPSWGQMLHDGFVFFACLISTLGAHEMGHYLQARRYRVPATMPYFIPFPISPFGTMGAVIIQQAGVADRKSMFDIAISGPLAGLVFAVPILLIGIHQSRFVYMDPMNFGTSYGDPLLVKWLARWMLGPYPPNHDLLLNAWLFAGWVGIFITALNLIPVGQLDGGHILYTLVGRRAHVVSIAILVTALSFMFFTGQMSYVLMVVLLLISGPRHPPTANDNVPLGPFRIVLGWLTLAFVIIGFTPVPISTLGTGP